MKRIATLFVAGLGLCVLGASSLGGCGRFGASGERQATPVARPLPAETTGPLTTSSGETSSGETVVETPTIETPTIEPLVGSYLVEVVSEYPHDPSAYTQGLELHDGLLLESTGRYGESDRRLVQPETGEILESEPLADDQFGEGLTVVGDRVIQLTLTNGIAIVSDEDSLDTTTTFSYSGEGWGLCFDGRHLVMSDGSATLTIRDPDSFDIVRTVAVADNGVPVPLLNELECRAGQVLANVYGSDSVVVISPSTGAIDARIGVGSLRPSDLPIDDLDYALNGIAFDARSDRFFVTGKSWPVLYEVSLVPSGED